MIQGWHFGTFFDIADWFHVYKCRCRPLALRGHPLWVRSKPKVECSITQCLGRSELASDPRNYVTVKNGGCSFFLIVIFLQLRFFGPNFSGQLLICCFFLQDVAAMLCCRDTCRSSDFSGGSAPVKRRAGTEDGPTSGAPSEGQDSDAE